MGLAVIYQNYADGAVLSGGDFMASLPLNNLRSDDVQLVARTNSVDPSATTFNINLGANRPIGGVIIGPVNVGPNADFRIRSFNDSSMTLLAYDSGIQPIFGEVIDWSNTVNWLEWEDDAFWMGIIESDLSELPQYLIHTIDVSQSLLGNKQFWRVDISDLNNGSGYLDIGRLYMGRIFRPAVNYAYDSNELAFDFLIDVTESLGGRKDRWFTAMKRRFRCSFPLADNTEAFGDWYRMIIRSRTDKQIFVIPEESEDDSAKRKRAFLATMIQTPSITQVLYEKSSLVFDVEEVI